MCGRYNLSDSPAVHLLLNDLGINIGPLPTRYNIAPTEPALTIIGGKNPAILEMRWWFTPSWSEGPSTKYAMFNARSETVASNKAFKGSYQYHRGIVPASSFIEWQTRQGQKQAFAISNKEECLFLAAVWELWNEELFSCAILTTKACTAFKAIHDRQPLVLNHKEALLWLNADPVADKHELKALMDVKDLGSFYYAPLEASVGNTRNKMPPNLIEPYHEIASANFGSGGLL